MDEQEIIDDFKARFPFFDGALVDRLLPFMLLEYPAYYNWPYKDQYKVPIQYLLAHLFYLETQINVAGTENSFTNMKPHYPMSSESMGDLSGSYDITNRDYNLMTEDFFKTTQYGQRYLSMIESQKGGLSV